MASKIAFGANLVQRAIGLVNEAHADRFSIFDDQAGRKGVRAQMKVRNRIGAGQQRAADFAPRRIAMRMQNARAAVRGFASEGELRAGTIEFRAPFDQLRDVLRAFFNEQCHRFGPAKAVARIDRVLFVEADFVFVAEGHGNAALRPGSGRIAQDKIWRERGRFLRCSVQWRRAGLRHLNRLTA